MKVVLDTNVLLSALFTRGVCEALFDKCPDSDDCELVLSQHILQEFAEHATGKFGATEEEISGFLSVLRAGSAIVVPAPLPPDACPDPDDLPVLGTAVAGAATALVTGDGGLLSLGSIRGIPIVSPRVFYDRLP